MKRAFTRSQIEDFFNEHWGKSQREMGNEVEIGDIEFFSSPGQPVWNLEFTVVSEGRFTTHRYHSHILFIQEKALSGEWRITWLDGTKLPPDCPTVAEEDKAIKAEAEEKARIAERRARVETHMAADYGGDY